MRRQDDMNGSHHQTHPIFKEVLHAIVMQQQAAGLSLLHYHLLDVCLFVIATILVFFQCSSSGACTRLLLSHQATIHRG